MDKPVLVFPIIYILELEDGCYYVGQTFNLNFRLSQHYSGQGAKWTRLHKPVSVLKVIYPATEPDLENKITKEYITRYGKDKVKGGSYCAVNSKFCRDCGTPLEPSFTYIYCLTCAKDKGLVF